MPYTDLPLTELRDYRPDHEPPADLQAFWSSTLEASRQHRLDAVFRPEATPLRTVDVYDASFRGFAGDLVRAWLRLPAGTDDPLPAVVEFIGYGGGRGMAHQDLLWPSAGYAHLIMDSRGQGSTWQQGDTADPSSTGAPRVDGMMTDGIDAPETYYFRRLITDAVRAVEAVRSHPLVDPSRVTVAGGSQGGGLAIAVAGLVPDLFATMPDVPFLCDFPRAIRIADSLPYTQIAAYLAVHRDRVEEVERTLAYVDAVNLGVLATAPALFSVALMDTVCPPSTVYAAFNRYGGPAEMVEYPFNDHEGGRAAQEARQLAWLGRRVGEAG